MPTPGSHAYDEQRSRLRKDLEHKGLSDARAEEEVDHLVDADGADRNPGAQSDRAKGPKGERPGNTD